MNIHSLPLRRIRTLFAQQLAVLGSLTCVRCGGAVRFGEPFDLDHIRPRAAGGSDAISNLGIEHPGCNRAVHANLNHRDHVPPAPPPSRVW